MSYRIAELFGPGAGLRILLPLAVLAVAALAGTVTAAAGSSAGYRAAYYVAVFALMVAGVIVAVTRREPLRFAFLALILCLPVASALVPPARIGLTVFDAVMLPLTLGFVGRRLLAPSQGGAKLFPTRSLLIAWLFTVPCIVFSQFPVVSLETRIVTFTTYVFFLYVLEELERERGFERLVLLFSVVSLVIALGLFVDHFLHLNLSLRGTNLNQSSTSGGMAIWRAGGFFQDPQRAGAFLACLITFLLLLSIRGRFSGMRMRYVVWAAIAAALAALATTISRSAILACALVSTAALFAFNKWSAPVKLLILGGAILAGALVTLTPADMWLDMLPAAMSQRFQQTRAEFDSRLLIWLDTWNMFAEHPLTGIGPGSFQPYLVQEQPTVLNYYGIGEDAGVPYVPDQPENGYLKILYEGGIAGVIAALLLAGDAFRRAVSVIAGKGTDPLARTETIAALAGLATFAVTFITLYTVSDPRIAAVFALLLAVVWHRSLQRERSVSKT